ncbi:MAG TPA: hypothetical protein VFV95_15355 [Vicinamibacterales bacterium]|nr:hypothetical protein [Vicinamibacterales bacterium]
MTVLRTGVIALLVAAAVPVAAQSPAGRWKASINTPRGPFPLVLEFVVDRGKVTGTVSNDFTPRIPIEEGTVKGSQLSFKLRLQTVTLGYSGSVAGDKLTLKTRVLEERPSAGPTLGAVLQGVAVISAAREK